MTTQPEGHAGPDRRQFLSTSSRVMGAGWLAMHLPLASVLAACSREAAERGDGFTLLTPAEGRTMAALAEAILPSDDEFPGAREAGAVHFVDGALEQLFPQFLEPVRSGLRELNERAAERDGSEGEAAFALLPPDERDEVVRAVEDTPFFQTARMLVVMGTFSDPVHGGNRDLIGFELLGMEHAPAYEPPFGHYDAEYAADDVEASTGEGP